MNSGYRGELRVLGIIRGVVCVWINEYSVRMKQMSVTGLLFLGAHENL